MCRVILGVKEVDRRSVKLKGGESGLESGRELTKYSIIENSPSILMDGDGGVIIFKIGVKQ